MIVQFDKLKVVEAQEPQLRSKFDSEQAKAANRTVVEQLEEMKRPFNVMLRQLPNKTDIEKPVG
jgi:Tfp pilus assembly protein PilO